MHGLVALEPDVALGLVGGEIVEDDMDFALRIGGVAGINIKTSPDNFRPIRQLQLRRFNGEAWERLEGRPQRLIPGGARDKDRRSCLSRGRLR
jgi:hypothetical protein